MKKAFLLIAVLALLNCDIRVRTASAQTGYRTAFATEYRNGMTYGIWTTPAGVTVRNLSLDEIQLELAEEQLRRLRAGK